MHGQEQDAVAVVEPAQQRLHQRYLTGADRARLGLEEQFLDDQVLGLASGRRQAPDLQWHLARQEHLLIRRISVPDHQRPEQFVPRDHIVERALEDGEVHLAGDPYCADDHKSGAERAAVIALVQGEEPFLGERQRVPRRFPVRRERGFRHRATPLRARGSATGHPAVPSRSHDARATAPSRLRARIIGTCD
jgi:hypothetical protein